jgi:hypothetical protein
MNFRRENLSLGKSSDCDLEKSTNEYIMNLASPERFEFHPLYGGAQPTYSKRPAKPPNLYRTPFEPITDRGNTVP